MKKHFADDVSVAELYEGISYISTGKQDGAPGGAKVRSFNTDKSYTEGRT